MSIVFRKYLQKNFTIRTFFTRASTNRGITTEKIIWCYFMVSHPRYEVFFVILHHWGIKMNPGSIYSEVIKLLNKSKRRIIKPAVHRLRFHIRRINFIRTYTFAQRQRIRQKYQIPHFKVLRVGGKTFFVKFVFCPVNIWYVKCVKNTPQLLTALQRTRIFLYFSLLAVIKVQRVNFFCRVYSSQFV